LSGKVDNNVQERWMAMLDILRKRRSIRRYKDRKIEDWKIEQLKEAALRSPSSRGINPWRFIFAADKPTLQKLSKAKESGSGFLEGASHCVVICAVVGESDVWVEDCSIAAIILQLAGQSLDLGSCWIQIRQRMHSSSISSEDYIKQVLVLPDNFLVESMIAFGYPDEEKEPIPIEQLEYGKISGPANVA
jgi:nitroreductase